MLFKIFTAFTIANFIFSQDCGLPNQNKVVVDQAGVDALATCTEVPGTLRIQGESITSFKSLTNLKKIGLSLDIYTTGVTDLSGLENLQEIGELFFIHSNSKLVSLDALTSLHTATGGILIYDNAVLSSISGLSALTSINPNNLPIFEFGISIYRNPRLTTLKGLENLKSVGNLLRIESLDLIANLSGLPTQAGLTSKNVTLSDLKTLNDITALTNWRPVPGYNTGFELSKLKSLVDIKPLTNLANGPINNLIITSNSDINDISIFNNSTIVGPTVNVYDNGDLCNWPNGFKEKLQAIPGANVTDACGTGTGSPSADAAAEAAKSKSNGNFVTPTVYLAAIISLFFI
ncbi:hypothetical protein HDU92_002279 [Lobulomyces angularis]|nr:hypothetical protein HDU92_002279 [Lobulomyces angularis]